MSVTRNFRRNMYTGDEVDEPLNARFAQAHSAKDVRAVPYAQRVGCAILSFIHLYSYMHEGHAVAASSMDEAARSARADTAVELAVELQRAILALCGTHRRRAYAHDLVYGMHALYKLFAKPWNAATEGNEHAHQDMKKYFHDLVTHKCGDCLAVLKLFVVKQHVMRTVAPSRLMGGEYGAQRANTALKRPAGKDPHGAKFNPKLYKGEGKMEATAGRLADPAFNEVEKAALTHSNNTN